jgi:hypothetical protein
VVSVFQYVGIFGVIKSNGYQDMVRQVCFHTPKIFQGWTGFKTTYLVRNMESIKTSYSELSIASPQLILFVVCFLVYLTTLLSCIGYITSNGRMSVSDNLGRI